MSYKSAPTRTAVVFSVAVLGLGVANCWAEASAAPGLAAGGFRWGDTAQEITSRETAKFLGAVDRPESLQYQAAVGKLTLSLQYFFTANRLDGTAPS